jgi:hypothetical protein
MSIVIRLWHQDIGNNNLCWENGVIDELLLNEKIISLL